MNREETTKQYREARVKIRDNPRLSIGEREVFLYRLWRTYISDYAKLMKNEKELII